MNLSELEQKLIAAARSEPLDDRVPYGFERRIMARLGRAAIEDPWAAWSRALWRAAAPCIAIALLLSVWSVIDPAETSSPVDLSQDFENTVLAAAHQDSVTDVSW